MPEGDTVWGVARTLDAVPAGWAVTAFASSVPAVEAGARRLGLVGRVVEHVEARGKHLLVQRPCREREGTSRDEVSGPGAVSCARRLP
jgi:formamidopyrimidine-DNA glycosylase